MDAVRKTTTETKIVYKGRSKILMWMVGVLCAAVYGVGLWATSSLVLVPGATWVRPVNVLSEIFSIMFGQVGIIAITIGNTFSDFLQQRLVVSTLWWVLPVEYLFTGFIAYWGVTDPSLRSKRGWLEWLVFVVIGQGFLTGFGLAFFASRTGLIPREQFISLGWIITANEALPALFLGGLLQYLLFPLVVKSGFWWGRDLNKSHVPPEYLAKLLKR